MTTSDYVGMYTALGWRLIACRPHGKDPLAELVPHGVKDASSDPEVIRGWLHRWPELNIGVATGAPGPMALDIDDPSAVPAEVAKAIQTAPRSASPRGGACFFAGTEAGTIKLPYGELRGAGSYQMIPPSIHPSGKEYVWLVEPRGQLGPVPALVQRGGHSAGRGQQPVVESVAPGAMYDHLLDLSVRLVRAGIVHVDVIERVLVAEFEAMRVAGADYGDIAKGRRDTRRIAEFAAGSEIAERERAILRVDDTQPAELREELARLLRLQERGISVQALRLVGNGPSAALEMRLSNRLEIVAEHFGDLWTHTGLARFITQSVGINAGGINKADANRANALIRELAELPQATTTADLGSEHGHDFLGRAQLRRDFELNDQDSRYRAFEAVEQCNGEFSVEQSIVLVDERGTRYVHCGHLFAHVRRQGRSGTSGRAGTADAACRMVAQRPTRTHESDIEHDLPPDCAGAVAGPRRLGGKLMVDPGGPMPLVSRCAQVCLLRAVRARSRARAFGYHLGTPGHNPAETPHLRELRS